MTAQTVPECDRLAPTIFHQPWWLEAATGGRYDVAEVEMGGQIVGRLPYLPRRRLGFSMAVMPILTHFLGPALLDDQAGTAAQLLRRHAIIRGLLAKLAPASHVWLKLHGGITDTLPFEAAGLRTGVQFTALLSPQPEAKLWAQMRDKTRNVIRRAGERLTVASMEDPDRFLAAYQRNLDDRRQRNHYAGEAPRRLIGEALRRGQGRIIAATDDSGEIAAAVLTVWDTRTAYFLMSTRTAAGHAGATGLVLWQAIREAGRAGLVFDFDGIRSQQDALFFIGFTPVLAPRYIASRSSVAFSVASRVARPLFGT